jgi:uncharacterized repeat protein (TIGR03803 family)
MSLKQMSFIGKFGSSMMLAALWLCASGSQMAAQTFTTLLSFDGTDGANSTAGLVRARDGNFYGTASEGGTNNDGTVFRISPSGALTTIYSFCSKSACSDGANPMGALIQATDGNYAGPWGAAQSRDTRHVAGLENLGIAPSPGGPISTLLRR